MARLILLLCCLSLVLGQDSALVTLGNRLYLDVAAGGYYQAEFDKEEVLMPEYLKIHRGKNYSTLHATDNPLFHGAYFMDLDVKLEMAKGFEFHTNLIGEHRGFSYGVYDTKSMILYPKGKVVIDQDFKLLKKNSKFFLSLGNKTDFSIYEGLTIYNLDAQGWEVYMQWGHLRFTRCHISDVNQWIGLNIGDAFDHFLSLEGLPMLKNWKSDIRIGHYKYRGEGLKFSSGFYTDRDLRIYIQGGHQTTGSSDDFIRKSAGLAGIKFKRNKKAWAVATVLEIRGYGANFNQGYKNTSVSYRAWSDYGIWLTTDGYGTGSADSYYGNTIGNNLYPLSLYDRPFSQWAAFTEYQGKDIGALTLQIDGKYHFYKSFMCRASFDINHIYTQGEESFMYPFYTAGIGWEPRNNNYFMLGISNKGMNLDEHYPTFYLYKYPFFHLEMKREI
jgi:hypothetical protein